MKAIIDRIRYDTEKADQVGKSNFFNEILYCGRKNGKFFLNMPSYTDGKSSYTNTSRLKKQIIRDGFVSYYIIPISRKKAFEWLLENKMLDAIEKYFPDLISSKKIFERLCIADLPNIAEKYFPNLIEDA